jgi:hypothetical protein
MLKVNNSGNFWYFRILLPTKKAHGSLISVLKDTRLTTFKVGVHYYLLSTLRKVVLVIKCEDIFILTYDKLGFRYRGENIKMAGLFSFKIIKSFFFR